MYLQAGHVGQGRRQDLVSHFIVAQLQLSAKRQIAAVNGLSGRKALIRSTAKMRVVLSSSNFIRFTKQRETGCVPTTPEGQLQHLQAGPTVQGAPIPTLLAAGRLFGATPFLCEVVEAMFVISRTTCRVAFRIQLNIQLFELTFDTAIAVVSLQYCQCTYAHQAQLRQGMKRLERRQKVGSQWQLCLQVPQVGQRTQAGLRCCGQLMQSSHSNHMLTSVAMSGWWGSLLCSNGHEFDASIYLLVCNRVLARPLQTAYPTAMVQTRHHISFEHCSRHRTWRSSYDSLDESKKAHLQWDDQRRELSHPLQSAAVPGRRLRQVHGAQMSE